MPTTYVVRQGEWLDKIAHDFGFSSWRTIYDAPENEGFRAKRPNPDIIYPGDELIIPDKDLKMEPVEPGVPGVIVLKRTQSRIRIEPLMPDGRGYAGHTYVLELSTGIELSGIVPQNGVVEHFIPTSTDRATLSITSTDGEIDNEWELLIGHLDPVSEVTGLKARLSHLQYFCGPVDGELDDDTHAALLQFQYDHADAYGLKPSGEPDADTLSAIEAEYGC